MFKTHIKILREENDEYNTQIVIKELYFFGLLVASWPVAIYDDGQKLW